MKELRLPDMHAYRQYLESHPSEWDVLDSCCRITISRFYRGIGVFEALQAQVIPQLAESAATQGRNSLRFWSAGCASGEEAYSLSALWKLAQQPQFPRLSLSIIATDSDPDMLGRCRKGRYSAGSLKDFPPQWLAEVFRQQRDEYVVRQEFRRPIAFLRQDIREEMPGGLFDLICCRNVAFTYFAEPLQKEILAKIVVQLQPGGRLVIGQHEDLPFLPRRLSEESSSLKIYRWTG